MTESSYGKWLDKWQRRGELVGVGALTSAIATAAAGHSIAAAVAFVVLLAAGYVVVAVEINWPLPGQAQARERATREWMTSTGQDLGDLDRPERAIREVAYEVRKLTALLEKRLPPHANDLNGE
jgi:hypothetical protein